MGGCSIIQTPLGSLPCGYMKEKRQFFKKGHLLDNIMGVHDTNESNMPRECHFMNSTTLKVISSSVPVTIVLNDGDSVLIGFRGYFKLGEVANMLGDKIGIWKVFGRFSVQNNKIIGNGLNEKALIRLTFIL